MKEPHENSPVVRAPRTRSGGASRFLMSATCAVTSVCKRLLTCWLKSAASICEAADWLFATELQLGLSNPERANTTGSAIGNLIFCSVERNAHRTADSSELAYVMVSRNHWNSRLCVAPATTDPQARSTVRRSTSHHWGERHSRDATLPVEFDHRLRPESNTGRSTIALCAPPLLDSSSRVCGRL